jgi:hypothetical protein
MVERWVLAAGRARGMIEEEYAVQINKRVERVVI